MPIASPSLPLAVIGDGLFAHLSALALAQRGFVVERFGQVEQPVAGAVPRRWYALSRGSVALLEGLGVALPPGSTNPITTMKVFRDGASLSLSAYQGGLPWLAMMVPEEDILRVLAALPHPRLRHRRDRVEGISWGEGLASLRGDMGYLDCAAVLGAEGAQSFTRRQMGLDISNFDYAQSALTFVLEVEKPHHDTAFQWFLGAGQEQEILAFLPLTGSRICVVWSLPQRCGEQWRRRLQQGEGASLCQVLEAKSGGVLGALGLPSDGFTPWLFPLQWRYARALYQRRGFLLGDAAHSIHPFAGQGANLGFDDLAALLDTLPREQHGAWVEAWGQEYARRRQLPLMERMLALHLLWQAFHSPWLPLHWGLPWIDRLAPLKRLLVTAV